MTKYADGTSLGRHSDGKLHVDIPDPGPDPLVDDILEMVIQEMDEDSEDGKECIRENWLFFAKRMANYIRDKMAVA